MPLKFFLYLVCFSFGITTLQAQPENSNEDPFARKVYTTASVASQVPIKIDGILDDEAWNAVDWSSDYVEYEPDNGTSPTEQTKMKIVYDEKNLYVAFKCYHKDPSTIVKRMGRRDQFPGDWVELNLDSYGDDRTAFSFTISASGVKGDEFISNNGNFDTSWNPIWYVSTSIDAEGWNAELRIPLSQLRFSNEEHQVWGIQSTRRYFNNEERSTWQPLPPNPPGWVSEFGELRGLKDLQPQKQLEIQPYGVSRFDSYVEEEGNPFRDGSDMTLSPGVDAKIGITNDLTVDLTINPDFGQVDADPGAVALDGFEIFFEERRPFFVENKSVFNYNVGGGSDNLFFSRRIGRSPQGSAVGPNTVYIDQPNNTTILGAAKFSGKTQDGWTIGLLESVTSREYAEVINIDGSREDVLVEPLSNYAVGRVQKDFNDRKSNIGGIFTAMHRNMDPNVSFLHSQAYSGGIDFNHNWMDRTFYANGKFTVSHVRGSKEAITATQTSLTHLFQRLDADHVEVDPEKISLSGTGGNFEIGKGGGGHYRYYFGGNWKSPEYELNDIGFLRQADDIRQYMGARRLWNNPTSWFRRANVRTNISTAFDFQGNYNRIQYEVGGFVNWTNNWWSEVGAAHKPRIFTNTFLRGGPRWRYNEENYWFFYSGTDQRKRLSFRAGHVRSNATQNQFAYYDYEVGLRYQPLNSLSMSLDFNYEENPSKTQYVSQQDFNGNMRYVLGEIDNKNLSATLRVNYNINPNLTIQYYGQPYIFTAEYSNFNFVNDAVAADLNDRVTWYTDDQIAFSDDSYQVDENRDGTTDYAFSDPDFAYVQFRSNLVIRWEYIPGSEIFLVWSQGITGLDDPENRFSTIIDNQLLNAKPQNTFLLKATYRFVL